MATNLLLSIAWTHVPTRIRQSLVGIEPWLEVRVAKLGSQMLEGQLTDPAKAANGIIIGAALAEKLAVKYGNTVLLGTGNGTPISATVGGIFKSGIKSVDEGQIYSLMNVAQTLIGQNGLVNQLRLRLSDPLIAQQVATRVHPQIGYKSASWQGSHCKLLGCSATLGVIFLTPSAIVSLCPCCAAY